MQLCRPNVDSTVPLEEGEHPSRGKEVGANTLQKMARQVIITNKLVMYLDSDEEDVGAESKPPQSHASTRMDLLLTHTCLLE